MTLAPEGRPFALLAALIGVVLLLGAWGLGGAWWYAAPVLWVPVMLWVPYFFRDPAREGPRGTELILAPAYGKVVSVAETEEPSFIGGRAVRVSIFMSVFDVHVNRHPISGAVELRDYRPGKFVNASLDKASEANERMSLGVRGAHGPVLVRQIAGLIARRVVTDPMPGDAVRQGERLGLIRFGSRLDTFFPTTATPTVRVGDRTVAGVSVIGRWPG